MSDLAPIVLFVYNRPVHARQTLESLMANELAEKSELFIYCDGPKPDASEEIIGQIAEVRKVIREKKWCGKVTIIESETNKGLANSIISGVTQIVNEYGKIIVIEDDLIFSNNFLLFMNEALDLYADRPNVYAVSGYTFPIEDRDAGVVLLPLSSTWGWGTWKDKWECFKIDPEQNSLLLESRYLRRRFNLALYDYSRMLATAKHSWGIHWYFSIFMRNGLVVFPTKSLVANAGFDGSGTNCGVGGSGIPNIANERIPVYLTDKIDLDFYSKLLKYFTPSYPRRMINQLAVWLSGPVQLAARLRVNTISYLKRYAFFRWFFKSLKNVLINLGLNLGPRDE